jgi:hypothetical protein
MKNRNYGWQYLTLQNVNIFVKESLDESLDQFYNQVMHKMNDSRVVGVLIKVHLPNGEYKTIMPLQRITKLSFKTFRTTAHLYVNLKGNYYTSLEIDKIQFQYVILNKGAKAENFLPNSNVIKDYKFGSYSLPLSTDLKLWGVVVDKIKNTLIIENMKYQDIFIHVKTYSDKQTYKFYIEDEKVFDLVDYFGINSSSFTRKIRDTQTFIVENGNIVFKSQIRDIKKIATIVKCKELTNKFLTLDLETRTIDGILSPYCVGIFDGKNSSSFYLSKFKSADEMMKSAILSLMKPKYKGYNVYIHNGSSFDLIFLLRIITQLGAKVEPLIKDGKFINIKLSWKRYIDENNHEKFRYHINFRDSFLILPSSLRKLSKAFNVENKGHFPFRFVNNPAIDLNYVGPTPDFSLFDGISSMEYNSLISNNWNLREETIKYCILDCVVLHQVLSKFNDLIFNKWNLNIHRFPTLSSIAFAIFRTHYLGNHYIPRLGGQIYDFIKQSYTGGRVDVIKPQGKDLYYYDVNSLYPTVYSSRPMPVGKPTYFEGDIIRHIPNAFGFFECLIEAPKDLHIPILQTHVNTASGMRTIAPLGNWTDVLFSEEMKLALSYGYKITVLKGYTFEKALVFDKYASDLFEIKQSHAPSDPMYLISKLLLNSLYGRFGMSLDLISHEVIDNRKLPSLIGKAKEHMMDIIDLNNGKSIISKISKKSSKEIDCDNANMNVSIGIASAITSYARIFMTQFLQNNDYNVYYTDTDSIVTDKAIDSKHIGSKLGQMKLEYKINKAVFLAPKVYGIISDLGKIVTKVKGFKDNINFEMLESLLVKNSNLSLKQDKWFRDMTNGKIDIKSQVYSLRATENKRQFVYDKRGIAVDTKPYIINENKKIIK